jgi:carboxymethylenebutenolidase
LEEEGQPEGRVGVVGFCMGGGIALDTAARRALGAAVTFYGGGVVEGRFGLPSLVAAAPGLRTPWLGLYGDLDKGIPPEQVEELRTAAARATVTTEVVRYADADHGFNNDDRPEVFDADAAGDAWRRTLSWLDLYAGPDPAGGPD